MIKCVLNNIVCTYCIYINAIELLLIIIGDNLAEVQEQDRTTNTL